MTFDSKTLKKNQMRMRKRFEFIRLKTINISFSVLNHSFWQLKKEILNLWNSLLRISSIQNAFLKFKIYIFITTSLILSRDMILRNWIKIWMINRYWVIISETMIFWRVYSQTLSFFIILIPWIDSSHQDNKIKTEEWDGRTTIDKSLAEYRNDVFFEM